MNASVQSAAGSAGGGRVFRMSERLDDRQMSREQRKLVEQLRDMLPEGGQPADKTLLDKLKDYLM